MAYVTARIFRPSISFIVFKSIGNPACKSAMHKVNHRYTEEETNKRKEDKKKEPLILNTNDDGDNKIYL